MYEPRAFLETVSGLQVGRKESSADKPYLIAVVDPAYNGVGDPKVTFEGETTMSGKTYPYISTIYPRPSDRVILAPVGTSYVIIGSLGTAANLNGTATNYGGSYDSRRSSTGQTSFDARAQADTNTRWTVTAGGVMSWGSGAAGADTNLYRSSVGNRIKTDDDLEVVGQIYMGAQDFTVFTPTTTGHGSATFQTRTGFYWKLGKMVFVTEHFDVLAAGSGGSNWQPGLPSTPDRAIISGRHVFTVHTEGIVISTTVLGGGEAVIFDGGSGAIIDRVRTTKTPDTNARETALLGSDLTAGALITISGWYKEA